MRVDSHQLEPKENESPSTTTLNERKLSLTLVRNLSTFKVNESANESESLNSHHLSSSFGPGLSLWLPQSDQHRVSPYSYTIISSSSRPRAVNKGL